MNSRIAASITINSLNIIWTYLTYMLPSYYVCPIIISFQLLINNHLGKGFTFCNLIVWSCLSNKCMCSSHLSHQALYKYILFKYDTILVFLFVYLITGITSSKCDLWFFIYTSIFISTTLHPLQPKHKMINSVFMCITIFIYVCK